MPSLLYPSDISLPEVRLPLIKFKLHRPRSSHFCTSYKMKSLHIWCLFLQNTYIFPRLITIIVFIIFQQKDSNSLQGPGVRSDSGQKPHTGTIYILGCIALFYPPSQNQVLIGKRQSGDPITSYLPKNHK